MPGAPRVIRLLAAFALVALLSPCPMVLLLLAVSAASVAPPAGPAEGATLEVEEAIDLAKSMTFHVELVPPATAPLPAVDPHTPLADLLPTPPKVNPAPVYLGDDLAGVPELKLEAEPAGELTTEQWKNRKARAAAAALHLNGEEQDGFLKALVRSRPDLSGVPFRMGSACRTEGERRFLFQEVAEKVRREGAAALPGEPSEPGAVTREHFWQVHTAVVAQVLPAEVLAAQLLHVRALASIPRPEATRALARVAVFSPESAVRACAVEALSVRRGRDYADVLAEGLRYPWPAAARNAAEAIVKLGRKDLAGHLVALLDGPDPRAPRLERVAGRAVRVAPELVRINHLRNCLLCHAPAEPGEVPEGTLVAEVPVPGESLPDPSQGYGRSGSNLLVRLDVTYLRQDFSALLEVKGHPGGWPAMQRFDFVVRKRVLTAAEARELRARLGEGDPGSPSPYRRAAAQALRALTGRDLGPRAGPWRRLLGKS